MLISARVIKALGKLIDEKDPRRILHNLHVKPLEDGRTYIETTDGKVGARVTVPQNGAEECYLTPELIKSLRVKDWVGIRGHVVTVHQDKRRLVDEPSGDPIIDGATRYTAPAPGDLLSPEMKLRYNYGPDSKPTWGNFPDLGQVIPPAARPFDYTTPPPTATFTPHHLARIVTASIELYAAPEFTAAECLIEMDLRGKSDGPYAFRFCALDGGSFVGVVMPYKIAKYSSVRSEENEA